MLNRSTAMFLAACALLVPVHADTTAAGAGVVDNTEKAKQLFSQAVPLNGNFKISGKNGLVLTYMHNDQPNMYPAEDPLEELMKMIEGVEDGVVSQTFGLESNNDNASRIRFNDGDKCMSAQWLMSEGVDAFGVAYECAVGAGAQSDTGIHDAKQWYLAIPVETSSSSSGSGKASSGSGKASSSSSSSSSSGSSGDSSSAASSGSSSSGVPCEKTPEWVWSHPPATHVDFYKVHPECLGTAQAPPCGHSAVWLNRHAPPGSSYMKEHPECEATYNAKYGKRSLSHNARAAHRHVVDKRGSQDGTYKLVLTDHIDDMETRCLVAEKAEAYADALAAKIALCDDSDETQLFVFQEV